MVDSLIKQGKSYLKLLVLGTDSAIRKFNNIMDRQGFEVNYKRIVGLDVSTIELPKTTLEICELDLSFSKKVYSRFVRDSLSLLIIIESLDDVNKIQRDLDFIDSNWQKDKPIFFIIISKSYKPTFKTFGLFHLFTLPPNFDDYIRFEKYFRDFIFIENDDFVLPTHHEMVSSISSEITKK